MATSTQTTLPPAGWYSQSQQWGENGWYNQLNLEGTDPDNEPSTDFTYWWSKDEIEAEYKSGDSKIYF